MKNLFYLIFGGFVFITLHSCADKVDNTIFHYNTDEYEILTRTLDLPQETFNYNIVNNLGTFQSTELPFHKATLGRVLFYDKALSVDGSTSCASCHKQRLAFADETNFSVGLDGQIGTRNSLPLGNTIGFVKYYGTDLTIPSGQFSWDEGQESINNQSRAAIESSIEMGHNMYDLAQDLKNYDYYQILFEKVYGKNGITETNILDAVTEFVNSFSSRESPFDEGVLSVGSPYYELPTLSAAENNGRNLFNNNCGSCHDPNHNAIVMTAANNGLDMVYEDKGMGTKFNDSSLNGVFKVPSLRNIELTAPYMHDGRFATLEDVVDHYSNGIQNHENLHFELKSGSQAKKFNFSADDKADLVAYLKTLTDQAFIAEVKWSDPFK